LGTATIADRVNELGALNLLGRLDLLEHWGLLTEQDLRNAWDGHRF
jgi:hypothetical protein